jgi:hypothetical protein
VENLAAGKESWSNLAEHLGKAEPAASREPALHRVVAELTGQPTSAENSGAGPAKADDLSFLGPGTRPGSLGRLSHYEILAVLGRGGFGVVLKAQDDVLDRVVAIKVLAPAVASNGTARSRFKREAKAAAAISHDHVVGIHAVGEANGVAFIVMQFIAGVSLQQRLDGSGPLELKEILRIGLQTAAGLGAAHAQGLVHRDIKPANILLENGIERVKITDFGLARTIDDASLTQSGVIAGTPMYMAPEQAAGEAVDHRADLFSLGSVLYTMCTGRPPFRATSTMAVLKRVIDETPQPIKDINPDIPVWLCDIIARLHAKKPADRFQSAAEVSGLLEQWLAHVQQPSPGMMPPALQRSPTPPTEESIEKTEAEISDAVKGPAAGLVVCGVLAFLTWAAFPTMGVTPYIWRQPEVLSSWAGTFAFMVFFIGMPLGGVFLVGARKTRDLRGYEFCVITSILAMLPISCHFFVGLPVGIWALRVLRKPEIKAAFRRESTRMRLQQAGSTRLLQQREAVSAPSQQPAVDKGGARIVIGSVSVGLLFAALAGIGIHSSGESPVNQPGVHHELTEVVFAPELGLLGFVCGALLGGAIGALWKRRLGHAVACVLITILGGLTGVAAVGLVFRTTRTTVRDGFIRVDDGTADEAIIAGALAGLALGAFAAWGLSRASRPKSNLLPNPPVRSSASNKSRIVIACVLLVVLIYASIVLFVLLSSSDTGHTQRAAGRTIAGTWASDWGQVTLVHGPIKGHGPVVVSGFCIMGDDKAFITRGTFDPTDGSFEFLFSEPANELTGSAKMQLSANSNRLEGRWSNSAGQSGTWTMIRGAPQP